LGLLSVKTQRLKAAFGGGVADKLTLLIGIPILIQSGSWSGEQREPLAAEAAGQFLFLQFSYYYFAQKGTHRLGTNLTSSAQQRLEPAVRPRRCASTDNEYSDVVSTR